MGHDLKVITGYLADEKVARRSISLQDNPEIAWLGG